MAEEIKEELFICSHAPRIRSYICVTVSELSELLRRIKELDYKSFVNVFEYAKKLDLPPDFQKELEFEYEKRGYKS